MPLRLLLALSAILGATAQRQVNVNKGSASYETARPAGYFNSTLDGPEQLRALFAASALNNTENRRVITLDFRGLVPGNSSNFTSGIYGHPSGNSTRGYKPVGYSPGGYNLSGYSPGGNNLSASLPAGYSPGGYSPPKGRRRLQQDVALDDDFGSYFTTTALLDGITGAPLQATIVRPSTGSGDPVLVDIDEGTNAALAPTTQVQYDSQPPTTTKVLVGSLAFVSVDPATQNPTFITATLPILSAPAGSAIGPIGIVGLAFRRKVLGGFLVVPPFPRALFDAGTISVPAFTVAINSPNPVPPPGVPIPGGSLTFGSALPNLPKLQNTDVSCAPGIPPIGYGIQWTVALQALTATPATPALGPNNVNFCPTGSGCGALISTGNYDLGVPPDALAAITQLLGLGANPARTVDSSVTGRPSTTYPPISCDLLGRPGPTIDFQIQDRVYRLGPDEYIQQYTKMVVTQFIGFIPFQTVVDIPKDQFGPGFPPADGQPLCLVSVDALDQIPGSPPVYILGAPFVKKYSGLFVDRGVLQTKLPRGVPLNLPEAKGGGAGGGPEENVCLFGLVPVKAVCASPGPILVDSPTSCVSTVAPADLPGLVSLQNALAVSTTSQQGPTGPPSTKYTAAPVGSPGTDYRVAPNGKFRFLSGKTIPVTLTATTPTTPTPFVDTCTGAVAPDAVTGRIAAFPVAVCKPTVVLPAKSKCAAQPTVDQLIAAINSASAPSDAVLTLDKPGPFNLDVGSITTFTLTVTNCAGVETCTSVVTVTDQEPIDGTQINCGKLPADGVVETPLITKTPTTPLDTYTPSYTKANGCPTTTTLSNLVCTDCLLGTPKVKNGDEHCVSTIDSDAKTVSIFPKQLARVTWTAETKDKVGNSGKRQCAICADHADDGNKVAHCLRPFTETSPCTLGHL